MTVEQAIQTAIEYETKVRDVYREAVNLVNDERGRRVLGVLADEEQSHIDYLHTRLDQWRRTGLLTAEGLETVLPARDRVAAGVARLQGEVSGVDPGNDLDVLERALRVELETQGFYKTMVNLLPENERQLFNRFLEIEQGHVGIVQAEIDHVRRTGYWFDFCELDLNG